MKPQWIYRVETTLNLWAEWVLTPVPGLSYPAETITYKLFRERQGAVHSIHQSGARVIMYWPHSDKKNIQIINRSIEQMGKPGQIIFMQYINNRKHQEIIREMKLKQSQYYQLYNSGLTYLAGRLEINIK